MGLHLTGSSVTQLNNALVPKWQPSTAYTAGTIVMAPDGSIVKRLTDGTSGSSYTTANWQTVATVAGTQAQTELATALASRNPTLSATTYDSNGNLTAWSEDGVSHTATYNTDGTIATLTVGTVTRTFTYDASGNLTGAA